MSKIYLIRGEKVMLDRDLALLYGVKSIRLREQERETSQSSRTTSCTSLHNKR
jgi:hypothetical protein